MTQTDAAENYRRMRDELPPEVTLVLAAKTRTADEIRAVLDAGATDIGENYVQEAAAHRAEVGDGNARWHMIGHLQRNKVPAALKTFDLLHGVDNLRLAHALNARADAPVDCLVEVNIASEPTKHGVTPHALESLLRELGQLPNLRVRGLMTMEPWSADPEEARPHLRRMAGLFRRTRDLALPGVELDVLSMGMSGSWRVAVEEGATMVRVGTAIFGQR
jgi:PLP dependent protein